MGMPTDIGIIDLMLAVPNNDTSNYYDFIKPLLMDEQSRAMFKMPAQYMFKDVPKNSLGMEPALPILLVKGVDQPIQCYF